MTLASTIINIGGPSSLVVLAVAAIAAVGSIIAAISASRSAKSVQKNEADAQRIRDLENRLSGQKYATYKPMIDLLGSMLSQDEASRAALADAGANVPMFREFATWISIYGSDEALSAWHNFTKGTASNPPLMIKIRLLGDFLLAARKDIGYPDSQITTPELIAMRINDFYDQEETYKQALTLPFDEACKLAEWQPPWLTMTGKIKLDPDGNEIAEPIGAQPDAVG
jgi:hypothetical protein